MSVTTPRPSLERDLVATACLTGYSIAVAIGFARVFSGWAFLTDLTVLVIVGHGVSFLLRRGRVSGWLAIPFVTALLLWLVIAMQYGDTLRWVFPTGATWDQIDLEVGLVRDQFQTAIAPVLYGVGWATLAAFAVVITVVMADSFAFRAEARGEALVPGGVLFVFIAALGSPRLRVGSTVLLLATGVIAVIALRMMHDRSRRVELTTQRTASFAAPTAVGVAAAVALLAGVIGPRLPGADAEPLFETRGRGGGVTEVLSPLVDIRSRLTSRSNVELFRVNADAPAYWRATTLAAFDGRRFELPRRPLEKIDGQSGPAEGRRVRQQIQVLSLGGKLIPAAADPIQAEGSFNGEPIDIRLNSDTNTLVSPDRDLQTEDLFTVVSAAPRLGPTILRTATSDNPPDDIFTELPDDLPPVVAETALAVTADATNRYDQAMALQTFFREFDYSLEVQSGHGTNAIESFLNERVGYCEQFSATYAAMARTLGIPSRVAVGFTPGVQNSQGWYSVLGKNAHAWPELWFDDIGWVAFEPTPGRGRPGAESYTDLPAQQDDSGVTATGGPVGDGTVPVNPTTPSTVVPPPTTVATDPSATTLPDPAGEVPNVGNGPDFGGELAEDDATAAPADEGGIPWTPIVVVTIVLSMLAAPALIRWWRLRATRFLSASERIYVAWERARDAAERAGVGGTESMTTTEWADATAEQLPVAARPMSSLAEVVDRVGFSRPGSVDLERAGAFGATLRHDCDLWSNQVSRIANDQVRPVQRVKQYFTIWN